MFIVFEPLYHLFLCVVLILCIIEIKTSFSSSAIIMKTKNDIFSLKSRLTIIGLCITNVACRDILYMLSQM